MTIKGVAGLSMSPAASGPALTKLAAFIPEAKGSPASAGVFDWSAGDGSEPQALVRKSFFRTQGIGSKGGECVSAAGLCRTSGNVCAHLLLFVLSAQAPRCCGTRRGVLCWCWPSRTLT